MSSMHPCLSLPYHLHQLGSVDALHRLVIYHIVYAVKLIGKVSVHRIKQKIGSVYEAKVINKVIIILRY